MSTSQCAPEPGLAEQPADPAEGVAAGASKLLKGLLIGFAATVTMALALASWYVGVRIVAANAIPASIPAPAVHPAVVPAAEADSTLYLEVASLGAEKDSGFVQRLEGQGYQARVRPATGQGDRRILIGPFAARSQLEGAQRRLRSAGVLAMETAH